MLRFTSTVTPLTLRVRNCITATPRAKIVRLELGTQPFSFRAGQAALLGVADQPLRRPYSIASAPADVVETGLLEFLVNEGPGGSLGPHLAGLARGARVTLEGPVGHFELASGEHPSLFVAGGSGISPLRSMLRQLLAERAATPIAVAYSGRTSSDLAYAAELRRLARAGAIRLLLTTTREEGRRSGIHRGRLTADDFRSLDAGPATHAYVCGPQALVRDLPALLVDAGVAPHHVHLERW